MIYYENKELKMYILKHSFS